MASLNFVCAFLPEAKALIDTYQLKLSLNRPFPIYQNEDISLIISGRGKIRSAAATSYLLALLDSSKEIVWINVGLAGSSQNPIGSIFWINKITDSSCDKRYYSHPPKDLTIPIHALQTIDHPTLNYPENELVDMEGSGFFSSALLSTTNDNIHLLKIISDNEDHPLTEFDRKKCSDLIEKNIPQIKHFTNTLFSHRKKEIDQEKLMTDLSPYFKRYHFTESEKYQLFSLIQAWENLTDNSLELDSFPKNIKGKDLIKTVRERLSLKPLRW